MKSLMALSASAALLTLTLGCRDPNCEQVYYTEREPFFRTETFYNGPRVQYYGNYGYHGGPVYGGYGYYRGPRVNYNVHVNVNRPPMNFSQSHAPNRNFAPPSRNFTPQHRSAPSHMHNNSRHR